MQVEFIKFFIEGTEPDDEDVDAIAAAMMATVPDGRMTIAALLAGERISTSDTFPLLSITLL